ncbi:MAG: aminotransferase class III-fold pyridoxal phosphate-dependent enzyme [Candidatus Aminicenantes bacterium]|nr:aminotransferase class III-fold pyridoxal phosphate-dependent enzyme [Candidatus Aminicenantes bacterium]
MALVTREELLNRLQQRYWETHPKSADYFTKSLRYLIQGGSHNLRLFSPFPFYDVRAKGARVVDVDGYSYLDFWQGHFSNILGHNPDFVIDILKEFFDQGQGLITGFPSLYQRKLAERILSRIPQAEVVRFTTSGTLASMYAIMLARAFTRRQIVFKVGGGWHGAHPYGLKGITRFEAGLRSIESAGLPASIDQEIITVDFNNLEELEEKFARYGERVACLIMEPFIGAGGFIFAHPSYLHRARELTRHYGALLILDEVVSGFRFHAGVLQTLYGVEADLTVLGKAIGGGMPVSAVAGKREIMELCSPQAPPELRVKFEGGTFSAHPACMLAGASYIQYLIEHEGEIYPRIGQLGRLVRQKIEEIFRENGFLVCCTGGEEQLGIESSLVGVHFLRQELTELSSPTQVFNPAVSDYLAREVIFKLALLEEGVNTFHGFGAISAAHSQEDIDQALEAVEKTARYWRKIGFQLKEN